MDSLSEDLCNENTGTIVMKEHTRRDAVWSRTPVDLAGLCSL